MEVVVGILICAESKHVVYYFVRAAQSPVMSLRRGVMQLHEVGHKGSRLLFVRIKRRLRFTKRRLKQEVETHKTVAVLHSDTFDGGARGFCGWKVLQE